MKRILLALSFVTCWFVGSAQTYCTTGLYTTGCGFGDDINDFSLGSYSQTGTGCGSSDYTNYSDTIVITQSPNYVPLMVTTNYSGSEWFGIWVDWNDDGDFDDTDEFVAYSAVSHGSSNPYIDSILVDNTRPVGVHRLRVRVKFAGTALTASESCSSFTYGETQDYNLEVKPDIVGGCANAFSNFTIDSVLDVSAKITWTPGTGNTSWYLEYGTVGFTPGTGVKTTGTYPTNMPPVYLSSLTPNTAYEVYFGEICNSGADTAYFGNPQPFTTTVSCPKPIGLTAAPTSPTAGAASWSSLLGTSYEVIYGTTGFDPATGGTSANTSNTTYNMSSLTSNTSYDVYVIANCGAGGYSDTTGPATFRTPCTIFSVPYNENFDDTASWTSGTGFNNANAVMDPCWSRTPDAASPTLFQMGPRSGATGSGNGPTQDLTGGNYLFGEASVGGSGNIAEVISPAIDVSSLTTPGLYFFQHRYSAGGSIADMYVEVSNDLGASWDTVYSVTGEIQSAIADPWQLEFVNLAAYTGDTIMIKFLQKSNGCCGDAAIDSVVVDEAPTCPWPTSPTVVSTTDSSAVLTWNDPTGSAWELKWGPPGFTQASPGAGTANTIYNPDTIFPLQSNTEYEFYVRTNCGPNGSSIWIGPIGFKTECSPFMAPYSKNFDSDVANQIPGCWKSYIKGGTTQFASVLTQATTNAYSAPNALYIYNYNTDTTMAISPNFSDLDASDKQVRFKAYSTSTGAKLFVGTLSSVNGNTFSPIDTINLTTGYNEYIVKLDAAAGYNGTDHYVGLAHGQVSTFTSIYVDDFNYEAIPSCPPPLSSTLGTASVGSNSATLIWGNSGSDSTMIEVGATGFTPGTSTAAFVGGTQDTFLLATGLSPQTTYDFYVQDTCYGTGKSSWVGPFTFTTACLPVSAPYLETFDGTSWVLGNGSGFQTGTVDQCWTRTPDANSSWTWSVYNAAPGSGSTGPAADFSGTGNFLYTDASYSNTSYPAEIISPLIDVSSLTVPYVQFYYHRYGDIGEMGDMEVAVNDGSGWVTMLTMTGTDQTATTDPWKDKGVDVSSFGDTIQVRFRGLAKACCQGDMAIDQFEVKEAPSCPDPAGLAVSGITDSSASLTWFPNSGNPNYQVWFGPQGFFQGTATLGGTKFYNSTDSVYMDTLRDNQCYEYLVRAVCGPNDTSNWVGPITFCTPCLPFNAPYLETFDMWAPNCWDLDGGSFSWIAQTGTGGDNYAQADFWGVSSGEAWMTSPVINLNANKAVVEFYWSHLYSSSYPDDQLLVAVNKVGTSNWDTIVDLKGPTDFNDATAGSSNTPGNFILRTEDLDSMTYANSSIRVRFIGVTDFGPDCFINDFKVRYPVSDDLDLIGARFKKDSKCLSNSDTAIFQVQNILGSTVNFSNDPLTVHYDVTGPVNTTSSVTVNSGTLPVGDTVEVMATNIDLSMPGNYTLNAWIDPNATNLDGLNDTLLSGVNITIYDDWDVQPDTVVIINNMTDTVVLEASSPFLSGGNFFITEQCHFKTASGTPTAGWPSYLSADDYIEITGVPNSDLGGYTLEQWTTSSMVTSRTFPQGTLLGPNGTAIIMIGSGASTDDPVNFMYNGVGTGSYSWGSSGPGGRVLKDANGVIVDAVAYSGGSSFTFPAAANVTAADWSGTPPTSTSTSGIRLEGPDVNSATGWVASATSPQDPNALNANVPLPAAAATAGFDWKLNGVVIDTMPTTVVGPYTSGGVYNYVATFNGPCGIQSDTVVVIVNLPGGSMPNNVNVSAPACDSIYISWNNAVDSALVEYVPSGSAPGVGTLIVGDSSFAAVGLTPATNYDFYVANIKGGDTSSYVGPFTINSGTAGAPMASFIGQSAGWNLTVDFDAAASTGDRATYAWDFGDGNAGAGKQTQHTYAASGTYAVKLTVTNACGVDDTTITLADVSIGENILSNGLKLYPNPAKDVLNIELNLDGKDDITVRVMDVSGKQIMSATHAKADKKLKASMDLSELAKGVYMIEVSDGKYTAVRRLVKE